MALMPYQMIVKNEDQTREEVPVSEYRAILIYVENTDPLIR
jgi:hypothetical protein